MSRPPTYIIPDHEISFRASRAGGPGGQHVNTSATRVELSWNVRTASGLTVDQRARVLKQLANRIDEDGWLRVVASDSRSQHQNRENARERMMAMVQRALVVPNVRQKTRVPRVERQKRLTAKRRRAAVKDQRRRPAPDD
jgi:ribosome-associated protein